MSTVSTVRSGIASLRNNESLAKLVFLSLAGAFCLLTALSFFFLPLPTLQWFSDYWEHASALRVLAESPLAPSNPHYDTFDSDRQFIPFFVLLGYLMSATGISVTAALAIGATITTVAFCSGAGRFARTYFQHAWAPFVMLAVMLFAWGIPWIWTGFYEFRAHFYNGFYPASFVFSLTFFFWDITLRCLKNRRVAPSSALALLTLTALMFVSHQLGGLFAVGGAVLFIALEPGVRWHVRLSLLTLIVAGLACTWWWPYFNPIQLTVAGSGDKANEGHADFYRALPVLMMIGPALLGIPALYELSKKRLHLAVPVGFVALLLAYTVGGAAGHPVAHRFLSYLIIYLHLALVWKILMLGEIASQQMAPLNGLKMKALACVMLLTVSAQLGFAALDFARIGYETIYNRSFGSYPNHRVLRELAQVANGLPRDAIIFASHDPALAITALAGKVIARPRPQLMIADGNARVTDNAHFFSLTATAAERAVLVEKYSATHILVKPDNVAPDIMASLQEMGAPLPTGSKLVLIKLHNAGVAK